MAQGRVGEPAWVLNFGVIIIAFLKNFLPEFNLIFVQDISLSIIGGLVGYLSIWLIIYLYQTFKKTEGMGLGDAKLVAGMGLLFGWQSIPLILFISALLGLIIVTPSLLKKKKNLKSKIPFGPYIIVAGLIYFFFGTVVQKIFIII